MLRGLSMTDHVLRKSDLRFSSSLVSQIMAEGSELSDHVCEDTGDSAAQGNQGTDYGQGDKRAGERHHPSGSDVEHHDYCVLPRVLTAS